MEQNKKAYTVFAWAALCLLPPVLETIGERHFDRLRQTASGEVLPF